jgi:NAD(P)-dependent dehydrogenase (short-subunit alcohol dehydrogenase family)
VAGVSILADAIVARITAEGANCVQMTESPGALATDQGAEAALKRVVEALGVLDVLITAFYTRVDRPFLDIGEEWQQVLDENLTCAFLVAREAARCMTGAGGVIVHVGSDIAARPGPGTASFAAAKAGVQLMTMSMALDLAPLGIRVCSVAAPAERGTSLGCFSPEDEDIASAVAFCASDSASYVLGSNLSLTGPLPFRGA